MSMLSSVRKTAVASLLAVYAFGRADAATAVRGDGASSEGDSMLPLVVNTWTGDFSRATAQAWDTLNSQETPFPAVLNAVEQGCNMCEDIRCGGSVGYGGRPDTSDEVTLDSMVMFGPSHNVGSVGFLRRIKNAATVARAVMEHTEHTMLAGEGATAFAKMLGMREEDLGTDDSHEAYRSWTENSCQPNYYRQFEGAGDRCPPYDPPPKLTSSDGRTSTSDLAGAGRSPQDREDVATRIGYPVARKTAVSGPDGQGAWSPVSQDPARQLISEDNHDTIGIVVVDEAGDLACGTTTNGADHKINGRVGDSPVAGAGCYVDNDVGGAAATGDGDVMMRFLPSFRAVESMRAGASPQSACAEALCRIARFYPTFGGALVCANKAGEHGAARHGLAFAYSFQSPGHSHPAVGTAVVVDQELCDSLFNSVPERVES